MEAFEIKLPRYEETQHTMETAGGELEEAYQICRRKGGCREPCSPDARANVSTLKLSNAMRDVAVEMDRALLKEYAYAQGSFAKNSLDQHNECNLYLYLNPKVLASMLPNEYIIEEHDKFARKYLERARECSLETFMQAATYVGKGTGARCYDHLTEASEFCHRYISGVYASKNVQALQWKKDGDYMAKIVHVTKLWNTGTGPVVFVFDKGLYRPVAETREAAIIAALPHLTNLKNGTAHYPLRGRPKELLAAYGLWILEQAHQRFVLEPPLPSTMIRSVFRTARAWTVARALGRASSSDATTVVGSNSAKEVDASTEDNAATAAGGAEEGQQEEMDLDFDNLFDEIAVATTEPREEKSFAKMLRESKFMQLGDFNGRMVLGKVVRRVGNDLYVDFGLKFHAVCRAKPEDIGRYVMGSSVLLRLHDPELSERFLGSTRDLTLLEADATLIGPYRPGAKRGRPTGKAPPSEATRTTATAPEAAV